MDIRETASASTTGLRGTAPAARRAAPSSGASSIRFDSPRRQSTTERINEILEGALDRAERSRSISAYSPNTRSPQLSQSQLSNLGSMAGLVEHGGEYDEGQDDMTNPPPPDETTGIIMRGPGRGDGRREMNYQSIVNDGVRPRRRTDLASGRNSGNTSATDLRMEGPPQGNGLSDEGREVAGANEKTWYEKLIGPFQSIELENKGSVARDHLAIERTFLAWLRTSLAFASIGIAVTQLFRLNTSLRGSASPHSANGMVVGWQSDDTTNSDPRLRTLRQLGKPLGATFLAISILILFLGFRRYRQAQYWVIHGKFPASRGTIILVSFVTFAVTVVSLIVVVAVHPTQKET